MKLKLLNQLKTVISIFGKKYMKNLNFPYLFNIVNFVYTCMPERNDPHLA